MTKENIALLLTGVLILVIVGYLFFANAPKQDENNTQEPEAPEPIQPECPEFKSKYAGKPTVKNSDKVDKAKVVNLGDYGKNVLYLQQRLNSEYDAGIQEDGKFGCETFYAVQKLTGLSVEDGIDLNDIK